MYICTISEHDEAQGWVCPMQDPNEPVEAARTAPLGGGRTMTDEEMAAFVGRYYARAVRREPDAEQMAFFRKTVQSGLRPAELMAAIDYAVSVVGFEGVARDYWPHVQAEARRIWREMRAAGFLDRQENPSP